MSALGRLRRRLLTPDVSETRVDVRGFHTSSTETTERLETVGRSFLAGYGAAAQAGRPRDAETELERVPAEFRGFSYEGAAMALAVRDALPVGGRRHVEEFLRGRAANHVYMVYVGVGWAMARVPRMRWSALHAPDPLLRWLVLDGYGFHQAYFRTRRYVHEQYRHRGFPWPVGDPAGYAPHVIDQGVGRATWFVAGADPDLVDRLLQRFAEDRRADLFSGIGLAATYAGGASRAGLERLWHVAGRYRPQLAQGAAFACAARVRAALVMPHNELAAEVFCGMPAAAAAKVTDEALPGLRDGAEPAYAVWRRRISDAFRGHADN
ncbi:DUF1702 family protein [Dactylosporangium sp. NPDC000555]|uniref:DUF1702 family protein n=1 Tax=Dactylosporangium sp. NPDC000555 TaxID=3154260 RepID=UPI0033212F47